MDSRTGDIAATLSSIEAKLVLATQTPGVDVWLIPLDRIGVVGPELSLDAEELARSRKYRSATLRNRYTVCHVLLRHLLARYAGVSPRCLSFVRDAKGKPQVLVHDNSAGWQFNLSRNEGSAAIAISQVARLGIDIESPRPVRRAQAIAQRHYSPEEQAYLDNGSAEQRCWRFFRIWARKEAYVKATGTGLDRQLRSFSTVDAMGSRGLCYDTDDETASRRWNIVDLAMSDPCVSVVHDGPPETRVTVFDCRFD